MSPSQRLRPVHDLAVSSEESAGAALNQCRQDLHRQLEQLRQLQEYQAEYHRRFSQGRTLSPIQIRDFHSFLQRLQEAIDQQGLLIDSLRRRCKEKEQLWMRAHTRTQALDKAIDRHQNRELQMAERSEQKMSDELAQRRRGRF